MNIDILKSFEQLKLWTSILQLFPAKASTFDIPRFTYDLFREMSIQSKEKDI